MRRKNILLISAIISLIIIILSFFFLRTQFLLNKIRIALEKQLEKQLKHNVNIEAISGNVLSGLKVKSVEVKGREVNKSIIAADEVDINYRLWGLVKGKFLVTNLHFKKPEINAYLDSNGVLNLQTLVPKKKSNEMFSFLVSRFTIEEGKFNFADAKRDINVSATGIDMTVKGPLDSWNHSGNFAFVDGEVNWNGDKSKIDKFSTEFHISKDRGNLKLRLYMGDSWLAATMHATMKSVSKAGSLARYRRRSSSVGKAGTDETGTGSPARYRTRGSSAEEKSDSPFLETKVISEIDLKDLQEFFPDSENVGSVEGKVHINANASGSLSDISGQMALTSPHVRLDELRFDDLKAQAEFTKNSFEISSMSGNLADGKVEGSLSVNKTDEAFSYDSDIKFAKLNTNKLLPMLAEKDLEDFFKVDGLLDGTLKIKNDKANLETVSSFGDFELVDCAINDVKIAHSKAHYKIEDGKISLNANLDKAQFSIDGAVGLSSPLSLDLRINQIDTDKLAEILDAPEFSGTGSLTGKLSKVPKPLPAMEWRPRHDTDLLLQADISILDATLYNNPIGMVNGRLNYTGKKIDFKRITVEQGQTQCNISGSVLLSDQNSVQLKARLEPVEISKYRKLFFGEAYPVSGLMNGDISICGNLDQLNGGGNIKITEGKVWDIDLNPFVLPVKLDSSTVYIPDLVITSQEQKAYLDAKIASNGDYEFSLLTKLSHLPAFLFPGSPPFRLSELTCKAKGTGNLSNPEFDIKLGSTDIYYADQSLGELHLSGNYHDDTLSFRGTALNETCEIDGSVALTESMPYELNLKGKGVKLARFMAMVDSSLPGRIKGEVDGMMHISGSLKKPDTLKANLILPRLALYDTNETLGPSETLSLLNRDLIRLEFSEGVLHINSFDLATQSTEQSLLRISGDIDFQSIFAAAERPLFFSDLTVSSDGFELGLVKRILDLELPISGTPNFKLNLTGPVDSPAWTLDYQIPKLVMKWQRGVKHAALPVEVERTALSVEVERAALPAKRSIEIDNFSGKLVYRDNLLKVDCIGRPDKRTNEIQMTGNIPVDLAFIHKKPKERILDKPINLKILANLKAEFLNHFTPYTEQHMRPLYQTSGLMNLTAQVTNTAKEPEITGTIDFKNIDLISPVLPQAIKNGDGDVRFSILLTSTDNERDVRSTTDKAARFTHNVDIECVLNETKFHMGKGNYTAEGKFSLKKAQPHFSVNLSGKNIELEPLANHLATTSVSPVGRHRRQRHPDRALARANRKFAFDGSCDANLLVSGSGFEREDVKVSLISNRLEISPKNNRTDDSKFMTSSSMADSFVIQNSEPIKIELSDNLLKFKSFHLQRKSRIDSAPSESVTISGAIYPFSNQKSSRILVNSATNHQSVNISTHEIDLAKWTEMLNLPYQFAGKLSLDVEIGGLLESPTIEASWILDKPLEPAYSFVDKITGSINYSDRLLTLDKAQINLHDDIIRAEGDIPINLAITGKPMKQRILDKPIDLTLKGNDVELAFLSSFSKSFSKSKESEQPYSLIDKAEGIANINFAIKGTTAKPHYEGTLEVSGLLAELSDFAQPIRNGRLKIEALKGIILLEHLSCQMGSTSLLADGDIEMNGIIPKVLNITNFRLQNAQINDFARAFTGEKFAKGLFGHITAEANMKVKLTQATASSSIVNLQLKDVLIGWRDEETSAVQYRVSNSQDIEMQLKDQRLYFDFVLEDTTALKYGAGGKSPLAIAVKGDFELNEEFSFNMDITNFDISPVNDYVELPYEVGGCLNSSLKVRGTTSAPVIQFNWWKGERLSVTRANFDKFTGELTYSDQNLQLSAQTTIGRNYGQLSASIPFLISLNQIKPLNKESEGELDIKINNFEFAPLIDDQLSYMEGDGDVNITIGGPISNPSISGLARFDNISFDLPIQEIEVKDSELSAKISQNGIKINKVRGKLNNGTYELTGNVGLAALTGLNFLGTKDLNLGLTFENCLFRARPYWDQAKSDGDLRILGDIDMPVLEGNVFIDEARYEQSLQELIGYWTSKNVDIQTEASFDYPLLRNMELNVEVQASDNLWVTTGPVTVEGSAYGRIVGEIEKPVFEGRVDILQGEFQYLDHKFVIKQGYLSNKNPYRFNPKYFISAEIDEPLEDINLVDTEGQSHTRDVKINVNFSGYLEEHNPPDFVAEVLHKELGENYEFNRQQIISILTVGAVNMVNTDTTFLMTDTAPAVLGKQAQLYVGNRLAKLIGFRSLRLNLAPYSIQQSRFLVTKELSSRWAITYSSTLQIYEEPYIELEYQLNKHMAIKGERNEEGKYGVDLKLEYEFK